MFAVASLFKRGEDVRKFGRTDAPWTIAWTDVHGRLRRVRVSSDRRIARQHAARIEREVERKEVGLGDPFAEAKAAPIAQHVADFLSAMENGLLRGRGRGRPTARYVGTCRTRLTRALEGMRIQTLLECRGERAEHYLSGLLNSGKVAARTRDQIAELLRQFGAWLVRTQRMPASPWGMLGRIASEADITRRRRALTVDELERLCAAASVRPVAGYRKRHPYADERQPELMVRLADDGKLYGLLYKFAAYTGLRRNELKQLRWGDLDLDACAVVVRAENAKSRREATLPLHESLVPLLREARAHVEDLTPDSPVFRVPRDLERRFRLDATFAGIPLQDGRGRVIDVHCLRATFATMLARAGVPIQVARELMRHASITTTIKHYTCLDLEDMRRAIGALGATSGPARKQSPSNGFGAASDFRFGEVP